MPQQELTAALPERQPSDPDVTGQARAGDGESNPPQHDADNLSRSGGETDPEPSREERSKRLYIIEYGSENERKRAEYTLKNWEDAAVERPSGTIRIVEAENQGGLMNQLISTIPYDHIWAFDLEDVEISENVETVTLKKSLSASREGIETTLEFMFSQRSGMVVDPSENKYELDDKGPAEVSYEFIEADDPNETGIAITITGAPQTTEHLLSEFRQELDQFQQQRSER